METLQGIHLPAWSFVDQNKLLWNKGFKRSAGYPRFTAFAWWCCKDAESCKDAKRWSHGLCTLWGRIQAGRNAEHDRLLCSVPWQVVYCFDKRKTGQKRIPLVASYRSLLRWLSVHPGKNETNAPLWCALDSGHRGKALSYKNFRVIIKSNAKRARLSKDVWPYLFRHSQLTNMADKLTESKLELSACPSCLYVYYSCVRQPLQTQLALDRYLP